MSALPITIEESTASGAAKPQSGLDLLARLLGEQQQLTAVEQFAQHHSDTDQPREARRYRSLLPAAPPGPGQQYAFEVDLDRCSGCKACVTACHSLNGLDEHETWRDVGLLVGGTRSLPVLQHVTTACHHCLEPACMIACPVNAYEKDPFTGIVKHLDDQCFGCQYCIFACPYEVPKYHRGLGIVRKCDMCSSRLTAGEAPACVQACPHEAISIKVVDQAQIAEDAETSTFLPAAPDPQITLPSTTYKTKKSFPRNLLPADYLRVGPQHAHWPLVVMLVLTQLSVGAYIVSLLLDSYGELNVAALRSWHAASALGFGLLALGSSMLHLGRPFLAFRAVLGLRHSWLSREILAFGVFALLACSYTAATFLAPDSRGAATGVQWLGWAVATTGVVAIFCSAMIYVFTQRECWSATRVGLRFLLTSALLGVATISFSILLLTPLFRAPALVELSKLDGGLLCRALIILTAAKLGYEAAIFRHLLLRQMTPLKRSALLMTRDLSGLTIARFVAGVLGGILIPAVLGARLAVSSPTYWPQIVLITGMFVACLAGELLERCLFFRSCAAPRMPGGIR